MLKVNNLTIELKTEKDNFYILCDFSLHIKKGEIFGLAGESGSGKSVFAKSILGLNNAPIYKTNGEIIVDNTLLNTKKDYQNIRGKKVSMIFQNPQSSLNPVMTIGSQLIETILLHNKEINKHNALIKAIDLLKSVEVNNPEERIHSFPHQLSGGMNQRVMIAIALASKPDILIADEPTTALDVTIQEQIINLIKKLNQENNLTTLFISHDLALLSSICSKIAVLYSGELMEVVKSDNLILNQEKHPYTHALKQCIPHINNKDDLITIKGFIEKNNFLYNEKCIFADRCNNSIDMCYNKKPLYSNGCKCHNPYRQEQNEPIKKISN